MNCPKSAFGDQVSLPRFAVLVACSLVGIAVVLHSAVAGTNLVGPAQVSMPIQSANSTITPSPHRQRGTEAAQKHLAGPVHAPANWSHGALGPISEMPRPKLEQAQTTADSAATSIPPKVASHVPSSNAAEITSPGMLGPISELPHGSESPQPNVVGAPGVALQVRTPVPASESGQITSVSDGVRQLGKGTSEERNDVISSIEDKNVPLLPRQSPAAPASEPQDSDAIEALPLRLESASDSDPTQPRSLTTSSLSTADLGSENRTPATSNPGSSAESPVQSSISVQSAVPPSGRPTTDLAVATKENPDHQTDVPVAPPAPLAPATTAPISTTPTMTSPSNSEDKLTAPLDVKVTTQPPTRQSAVALLPAPSLSETAPPATKSTLPSTDFDPSAGATPIILFTLPVFALLILAYIGRLCA
jgi:hypothetical protein